MILFFFNDTATTEIYTLSLHDALPICVRRGESRGRGRNNRPGRFRPHHFQGDGAGPRRRRGQRRQREPRALPGVAAPRRSEEHTSELQSRQYLVCRLLLEKKKTISPNI